MDYANLILKEQSLSDALNTPLLWILGSVIGMIMLAIIVFLTLKAYEPMAIGVLIFFLIAGFLGLVNIILNVPTTKIFENNADTAIEEFYDVEIIDEGQVPDSIREHASRGRDVYRWAQNEQNDYILIYSSDDDTNGDISLTAENVIKGVTATGSDLMAVLIDRPATMTDDEYEKGVAQVKLRSDISAVTIVLLIGVSIFSPLIIYYQYDDNAARIRKSIKNSNLMLFKKRHSHYH